MPKQLNDWLDEFVENGADANDVANWPENAGSGGTKVIANPELQGGEPNLTGLQVGEQKYKIPAGGSSSNVVYQSPYSIYSQNFANDIYNIYQSGAVLVQVHNGDLYSYSQRGNFSSLTSIYEFTRIETNNQGSAEPVVWRWTRNNNTYECTRVTGGNTYNNSKIVDVMDSIAVYPEDYVYRANPGYLNSNIINVLPNHRKLTEELRGDACLSLVFKYHYTDYDTDASPNSPLHYAESIYQINFDITKKPYSSFDYIVTISTNAINDEGDVYSNLGSGSFECSYSAQDFTVKALLSKLLVEEGSHQLMLGGSMDASNGPAEWPFYAIYDVSKSHDYGDGSNDVNLPMNASCDIYLANSGSLYTHSYGSYVGTISLDDFITCVSHEE